MVGLQAILEMKNSLIILLFFLGAIALLSNIIREVTTLLLAPVIVKVFGRLSPISSGGATSMDVTLPVVIRFSGEEYAFASVAHGIILSLLVPIIITAIYNT